MSAAINSRSSRIMGMLTAVLCCLFIAVTPVKAMAAPAEGATVQYSGTSGTVTWEIYTDGTMVIRPTSGDEGTMESLNGNSDGAPWYSRRSSIKRVETQGTIHLGSSAAYMFCATSNCTEMDLSGFDTSNVTDMSYMFNNSAATSLGDLSGWNTSNVADMSSMFNGSRATSLDLSGWNTSNVTNMGYMFSESNATSLGDLSGWDTSSVTNMRQMFESSRATSLGLSEWDTSNVTDMGGMFRGSAATSLDLSGWDTSNVTNMNNMFRSSAAISLGDLSGWDTSNVTNMSYMFYQSEATSLDLSGWDTSKVTNMQGMFSSSKVEDIILGENFNFKGKNISAGNQAILPTPPPVTTTRKWIREDGTVDAKTPVELRDQYDANAAAWAGKWVWEVRSDYAIVRFDARSGYTEQTQVTVNPIAPVTVPEASRPGYILTGWESIHP